MAAVRRRRSGSSGSGADDERLGGDGVGRRVVHPGDQSLFEKVVELRLTSVLVELAKTPPESGTRGAKQELVSGVWPVPISVVKPNTVWKPFGRPQITNAVSSA